MYTTEIEETFRVFAARAVPVFGDFRINFPPKEPPRRPVRKKVIRIKITFPGSVRLKIIFSIFMGGKDHDASAFSWRTPFSSQEPLGSGAEEQGPEKACMLIYRLGGLC